MHSNTDGLSDQIIKYLTDKNKKGELRHPIERGTVGCYKEVASKFKVSSERVRRIYRTLRKKNQIEGSSIIKLIEIKKEITKEEIAEELIKKFKKSEAHLLEDLSDHFDVRAGKVKEAIDYLIEKRGYNLRLESGYVTSSKLIPKSEATVLDVSKMSTGFYKFGAIGDNHMGSKYERLDVLNAMYDLYEKEGVKIVYNTGNFIDGEARFNMHDLLVHGMDNQIDYFLKNYPQKKGITTYFITGDDHEGWYTQREGIDVGKYTQMKAKEAGREDLIYLGHMEADVVLKAPKGQTVLRVLHPGGGSSYAISYSVQKIVESYQGGEKPNVLFAGHYHKSEYTFVRGVHVVQTGTTEDQTPFMRKKKLAAHLGGWIVEIATDNVGAVTRFRPEFIPFYDNAYYKRNWKYLWK